MIINEMKHLTDYTKFLKEKYDLTLSFHDFFTLSKQCPWPGNTNGHECAFCNTIKSVPELFLRCRRQQLRVLNKRFNGIHFGMCYAGVEEFIYPMRINDIPFGFVSVSGYTIHQEKAAHRIKKISKATYLSYNSLLDAYHQLKPSLPDQRMLETLVAPAAHLYEYMYMLESGIPKKTPPEILIDNYIFYSVLEYIKSLSEMSIGEQKYTFSQKIMHKQNCS